MALQGLHVTEVKMRGRRRNVFAVTRHEAEDVEPLLQDAERGKRNLPEIDCVLHRRTPVFRFQDSGIVRPDAEAPGRDGLSVEIYGAKAKMPVLTRRDRKQFLSLQRVLVRTIVQVGDGDVGV